MRSFVFFTPPARIARPVVLFFQAMNMPAASFLHIPAQLSAAQWISPVLVALVWIAVFSLIPEPVRHKLSALFIAGAGAAYLSGGLGLWEFAACGVFTFLAYRGLADYRFIGVGWLLHTCWDIVHHLYGNPIIPFVSTSSMGCAICDLVLAIWYCFGARSIFDRLNKPTSVV